MHSLITILTVSIYGIAPVGFSQHETVDSVSGSTQGLPAPLSPIVDLPLPYFRGDFPLLLLEGPEVAILPISSPQWAFLLVGPEKPGDI